MPDNTLKIPGDITAATLDLLRGFLLEASHGDSAEIVLDLGEANMVDSAGIGLLIQAKNSLATAGKGLRLSHVRPDIARMFRMMRLDHHFTIEEG
ncbi:MAG TPA: STAS domain-containing protein [Kiritimatiellia bacterium]|nr:STAS domain-containing protein [Kiritimatiellia bacterium]